MRGSTAPSCYTLEQGYGVKIVVPGAGFLLNSEMGDFNAGPELTTPERARRDEGESRRTGQADAVELRVGNGQGSPR